MRTDTALQFIRPLLLEAGDLALAARRDLGQ